MNKITLLTLLIVMSQLGCQKDPIENAYQKCLKQIEKQIDLKKDVDKNDPMSGAMQEMAKGMGKAICEGIKETCKQDPDGAICQAAISQYK